MLGVASKVTETKAVETEIPKAELTLPPETNTIAIALEDKKAGEEGWVFCRTTTGDTQYARMIADGNILKGDLVYTCCTHT